LHIVLVVAYWLVLSVTDRSMHVILVTTSEARALLRYVQLHNTNADLSGRAV